jgi:hypothetical protein
MLEWCLLLWYIACVVYRDREIAAHAAAEGCITNGGIENALMPKTLSPYKVN